MSKIVKTWDGHQGELLYIKGKIAFIKESNGEVWFCLKTDIIDFDEINMEEYYVKDAGKITYIYGVDLEEHIRVIEKQRQRIAELEQELAELKEKAIVPRFEIGQHLYMIPTQENGLKQITEYSLLEITLSDIGVRYHLKLIYKEKSIEPYFSANEEMLNVIIFATEEDAQAKLKEIQGE